MSVDVSVKTQSKVLVNKEIIWQTDYCVYFPFYDYLIPCTITVEASWKKIGEWRLIRVDSAMLKRKIGFHSC
jgi:hypothetical protein